MKRITLISFLLLSISIYSQTPPQVNNHYYNYGSKSIDFDGFKYKNQYYETKPRGLKTFINDNEEHFSPELTSILTKKMKTIRTKDLVSNIVGWGLWGTGGIMMMNAALNQKETNGKIDGGPILKGFGVAIIGALIKEFVRPKQRHYYDFINTFNRKHKQRIRLEVTLNHNENLNFGVAMSF